MKTKFILFTPVVIVLLAVCLTPLLSGYSTTKQYPMSFAKAEAALFDKLNLNKTQVLYNKVMAQAKVEGELGKSMKMKLFAIDLHDWVPDEHLSFTANHIYDIGASGGEYIRFDLTAKQPDLTEITVNYTNRWVGIWPPFIYLNPGSSREKNIHKIIWQETLPTN